VIKKEVELTNVRAELKALQEIENQEKEVQRGADADIVSMGS